MIKLKWLSLQEKSKKLEPFQKLFLVQKLSNSLFF